MFKITSLFVLFNLAIWTVVDGSGNVGLEPELDAGGYRILELRVANTLKCRVTGENVGDLRITWRRGDKKAHELNSADDPNKFEVVDNNLVIRRTVETDVQTYTCEITPPGGSEKITKEVRTLSKPYAKINAPAVFIEGQKLKMECLAHGKPTPDIVWRVNNETYEENRGRVKLMANSLDQKNGIIEIDSTEMSDRGNFVCVLTNEATDLINSTVEAETYVRVKDKLAALWPFLGICAEVIILCAIIFVYERNRPKVDMDESDTDGVDQKGASDHGKDSVRQRK